MARIEKAASADEFIEKLVAVNRVAKVVKGGRQFGFTALTVVGDGNGRVGFGYGKAREVPVAIQKAMQQARKNLTNVSLRSTTLHFAVTGRHGTAKVYMQPAADGTGVIAGGSMRAVFECAGVQERARQELRLAQPDQRGARHDERARRCAPSPEQIAAKRGKHLAELTGLTHMAKQNASVKTVKVTLVKSVFGQLRRHRATASGLGLRRMNQTVVVADTRGEPRHDQRLAAPVPRGRGLSTS